MLEGLAGWVGGATLALLIWAGLGAFLAAVVWVVMIVWRGGDLPLRSERLPDGRRRPGALVWLVVFVLVLTFLPLGILAYRLLAAAFWATAPTVLWGIDHWWIAPLLGGLYGGWRLYRWQHRTQRARRARQLQDAHEAQVLALPHDPIPHGEPRTGLPVAVRPDGSLVYPQPQETPERVPDEAWARPAPR